ncbi:MAG: uroporphyrinogen decarboxylase family protein [Limnochordia bacterium]|jgi:uroporphyrinogen decarboxylase
MNHRERLLAAINHRTPDRVPVDLGSTAVTSLHIDAHRKLKAHFGIDDPEEIIINRMMQTVLPHEEILKRFDVDVRGVFMGKLDSRPEVERSLNGSTIYTDEWGVTRIKPPTSHYYDLYDCPFDREDLTISDVENYDWPDPDDPGRYRGVVERARELREKTDYGVMFVFNTNVVHVTQFMRGFHLWFEDLLLRPKLLQAMMRRLTDIHLAVGEKILPQVAPYVDIVQVSDDMGTQDRLQFSPLVYRELIKPFHREIYTMIHDLTPAKLWIHSCGAISEIIDDLIEIGVDIINPVQVSAKGMEIESLKERFGDRAVFWGGIDTQRLLPQGSPEEVAKTVRRTAQVLGQGGGYVLCGTHNIQPEVPVENIITMYDAIIDP